MAAANERCWERLQRPVTSLAACKATLRTASILAERMSLVLFESMFHYIKIMSIVQSNKFM